MRDNLDRQPTASIDEPRVYYTDDKLFESAAVVIVCLLLALLLIGAAYLLPAITTPINGAVLFAPAVLAQRLGRLWCGLRGHDPVLHFETTSVRMRCTSCGHDSPGWEIDGRTPRKRFDGDAARHLLKPRLRIVARKRA